MVRSVFSYEKIHLRYFTNPNPTLLDHDFTQLGYFQVLRLTTLEPPVELLRAAALVHGSDYEEPFFWELTTGGVEELCCQ